MPLREIVSAGPQAAATTRLQSRNRRTPVQTPPHLAGDYLAGDHESYLAGDHARTCLTLCSDKGHSSSTTRHPVQVLQASAAAAGPFVAREILCRTQADCHELSLLRRQPFDRPNPRFLGRCERPGFVGRCCVPGLYFSRSQRVAGLQGRHPALPEPLPDAVVLRQRPSQLKQRLPARYGPACLALLCSSWWPNELYDAM